MSPFVWIVTREPTIKKLRRDDPRLDWDWPHTPMGMVRMVSRSKRTDGNWTYVFQGPTEAEAIASFNKRTLDTIARLESEIANVRHNLLYPKAPK
jgi:hypothetical protein